MSEKAFDFIERHAVRIAIIAFMVSMYGCVLMFHRLQQDLTRLERSINAVVSFDVAVSPQTAAAIAQAAVEADSGHPATAAGSIVDYVATGRHPKGSRINVLISL